MMELQLGAESGDPFFKGNHRRTVAWLNNETLFDGYISPFFHSDLLPLLLFISGLFGVVFSYFSQVRTAVCHPKVVLSKTHVLL